MTEERSEYINDNGQRIIKVPDPYTHKLYHTTAQHRDSLNINDSVLCKLCDYNTRCKIQAAYEDLTHKNNTEVNIVACGEFKHKKLDNKTFL